MLLVIGERVYDHTITEPVLAGWHRIWMKYGIRAALRVPGFTEGPARARLDRIITYEKRIINLLPPDCQSGSWDLCLAKTIASQFKGYLPHAPQYSGIVLLGHRVADVFFDCACFGDCWSMGGKSTLILPHPGGQSRVWNEEGYEKRVRDEWVPNFMGCIECGLG